MRQHELPALREHHVEVEDVREILPELHRVLVELGVAVEQVVRADDGGVAPHIAAADPTFLEHGDVADAVQLGEVESGRQTVPTTADDDDVVGLLRLRRAPGARPLPVPGERVAQDGPARVAAHGGSYLTNSRRGKSQKVSTPVSVMRMASEMAIPQSSSQMPGMKCNVMLGLSSVWSVERSEIVRSPQSGG